MANDMTLFFLGFSLPIAEKKKKEKNVQAWSKEKMGREGSDGRILKANDRIEKVRVMIVQL